MAPKKPQKPIKTTSNAFAAFRSDSEPDEDFQEVKKQPKYKKPKEADAEMPSTSRRQVPSKPTKPDYDLGDSDNCYENWRKTRKEAKEESKKR